MRSPGTARNPRRDAPAGAEPTSVPAEDTPELDAPSPARNAFPWDDALALGLGALRWSPAAFWAATPREFAAALGRRAGPESMTREAFGRLLAAYPDPT